MRGQKKQADINDEPDADRDGVAGGFLELLDPGDRGGHLVCAHVVHGSSDPSDGRSLLNDKAFRDCLFGRSQTGRFGNHILTGTRNEARSDVHCALMPASLMIGHHFAISAFWNAARPSGVCCSRGATSSPSSVKRARKAGSASASTMALLSVAMTSFGVPLGAKNPNHPDI